MASSFGKKMRNINKAVKVGLINDFKPVKPSYPSSVYIEPTNNCILACAFCMNKNTMKRERGYMDFELYKKIIDDIKGDVGHVALLGQGEPLMHKNIYDMVSYAKKNGLFVSFLTNGVLLKAERFQKLIDAGLDEVHISFDFANKELWMKYKGGSSQAYDFAYNNVLDAIKLAKKHGRPNIRVDIIKYKENLDHIDEYLEFWNKQLDGIGHAAVQDLINMWGLNDDDPSLKWYRDLKKEVKDKKIPDKDFPVCFSPWINCIIFWDGRVNACTYDASGLSIVGDCNNESFLDIWKGKKFQQYRKWCNDRVYDDTGAEGAICRKCNLLVTAQDNMDYSLKNKFKLFSYKYIRRNPDLMDKSKTLDEIFKYDFEKHRFVLRKDK